MGPALDSFEMLGRESGELVDTIDIEIGGAAHDLCIDAVYYPLLAAGIAGYYSGMHAGVPCSKRSVNLKGTTALFTRSYPDGVPWASDRGQSDIFTLNLLTERTATLGFAIKSFIIENPVDRGGSRRSNPWYRHEWRDHAPLWLSKHMVWLRNSTPIGQATFPLCALK